jgi:hypothetical protein
LAGTRVASDRSARRTEPMSGHRTLCERLTAEACLDLFAHPTAKNSAKKSTLVLEANPGSVWGAGGVLRQVVGDVGWKPFSALHPFGHPPRSFVFGSILDPRMSRKSEGLKRSIYLAAQGAYYFPLHGLCFERIYALACVVVILSLLWIIFSHSKNRFQDTTIESAPESSRSDFGLRFFTD